MADYTDNYSLAMPETGAENSGSAYNGNMEILDAQVFAARNLITKGGDIVVKNGDVLYKST